jgi:hypothetical protein
MNKRNKQFFGLLILGFIAIIIGANHKLNGNENAYVPMIAGMVMKFTAIICLITYNFSKLKILHK